jgi:hypothetical protein
LLDHSFLAGKKLGITDFVNPNGIGEQTVSEVLNSNCMHICISDRDTTCNSSTTS